MDLSIQDLIFKPETAGPGMLRPSAQGAGEAASLAAFNDLLGRLGQTHRNIADRLAEKDPFPASISSSGPTHAYDYRPQVTPSRQGDTASEPSTHDGRADASAPVDRTDPKDRPKTAAADPENDASDAAAPTTPTVEVAGNSANATPGQSAAVPGERMGAMAMAAATAAHAIQGRPGDTAPGQAVAAAVAAAVAGLATNRTPEPGSAPATQPEAGKALGLNSVVGSAGTAGPPDVENLALRGQGTGANTAAATPSIGAITAKAAVPAAAAAVLAEINLPTEIAVEKSPAFAQPRSPLAPGILVAQEVANSQAAVSQFQAGDAETGSIPKPGAGVPSGGAQITPQMAGAQPSGVDTLPSPASAAALESALGQPSTTAATSGLSTSGIFGIGSIAAAASGLGASSASTAAMRAQQPLHVPVDQFAVHVARAAATGVDHISIKLKPASLGQVEVKLEITHDGRIAAVVTAERSETLDMLQRDARALERALQEAGLKTDSNSLQFNLHGKNGSGRGFDDVTAPAATKESADVVNVLETAAELVAGGYRNSRASIGGMDIKV